MMRRTLPFEPTIAAPCAESWDAMEGNLRARHCGLCDRQVHNFAAMTAGEIERLILRSDGRVCARISRREDGSLVTLEQRPSVSKAAQLVASASLAVGAAGLAAQAGPGQQPANASTSAGSASTVGEVVVVTADPRIEAVRERLIATFEEEPGLAVLTGTVLKADGSGPAVGAVIFLTGLDVGNAVATSDASGDFRVVLQPGSYDILIHGNWAGSAQIRAAEFHPGEQSLERVQLQYAVIETVSGEMVPIKTKGFVIAMRHPWSYLKYLVKKL